MAFPGVRWMGSIARALSGVFTGRTAWGQAAALLNVSSPLLHKPDKWRLKGLDGGLETRRRCLKRSTKSVTRATIRVAAGRGLWLMTLIVKGPHCLAVGERTTGSSELTCPFSVEWS